MLPWLWSVEDFIKSSARDRNRKENALAELGGQIAVVTGGGTGMGWAVAAALANEGSRVVIVGRREAVLREAAKGVTPPEPIRWKECDVADRDQVTQLFDWVQTELGEPDILVNGAGINIANRMMANVDPADFDRVMKANTTGTFNCIHAVLPQMRRRQRGLIVNIVSIAGKRSLKLAGLPYSASKFAQAAIGTFVAQEAAEDGVRVTNLYPGETNTPIVEHRPEPPPPEQRAHMLQPEDIAECVLMVAKLPPRAVVPELVVTPPYLMLD